MFSMMTVEETAKPSKSRSSVAVAPQESLRPATTSRPGRDELALLERGRVSRWWLEATEREAERKPHETGS